ncbi:MAG: AMP-binding protein [Hyphomonadaceae bacterium]|nr:AMP-binding protein [Hyphomonadaceae bacterium]
MSRSAGSESENMRPGITTDLEMVQGISRLAIGDLLRRSADRMGDKQAILQGEQSVTYRGLNDNANRFANYLLSLGLAPKSMVATLCLNSIAYVTAIYGINKSGHVWTPINVALAPGDIRYILEHSEASVLVADRAFAERDDVIVMAEELGLVLIPVDPAEEQPFGSIVREQSILEPDVAIHERDLAFIMYTSGTTARPKGVMHCHLAVYVALLNDIGEWSVTREDRILIGLPLFHIAGHTMVSVLLAAGGTVHLRQGFDPNEYVDAIEAHGVTMTFALPMMYDAMLKSARARGKDTSSLRFCIYAMAPMPKTLLVDLIEHFCPAFALTSGQTEVYPMTVMFRPEQQLRRFGSYWGESAIINDTAIMDDEGNLLPRGQVGEIVHRGPNIMMGYFKNPEATAAARKFGWHHTGDLGYFDQDGQLVFADRKKDMIKTGGENVPSVLVEEVMLRHPAVSNAAAIGLPHPRWSEAVFACVTLHADTAADSEALLAHAREHLGGFQVPKGIAVLPHIPMTASGKCKKADLRKQFEDYFSSEE